MDGNIIKEEFKALIKEIIDEQIKSYMKETNVFRLLTGEIKIKSNDRYSIDIGDTIISDVLNKSGVWLERGDTVTIAEKIGSNFSNCFILCKNGTTHESNNYYITKIDEENNYLYIRREDMDADTYYVAEAAYLEKEEA